MKKAFAVLGMATLLTVGGVAVSATPAAPAPAAQAASYTSCFMALNGSVWCYRYACTAREEMAGCYEGWINRGSIWWA